MTGRLAQWAGRHFAPAFVLGMVALVIVWQVIGALVFALMGWSLGV